MDEVTINIEEIVEEVNIDVSETLEQVDILVQENVEVSLEVTEIVERVQIEVEEIVEEVYIEVDERGGEVGVAVTQFKVWSKPGVDDPTYGITEYCGFAEDLDADPSEAKWAVKRVREDESVAWAGFGTFDQILDDYLSLTYV